MQMFVYNTQYCDFVWTEKFSLLAFVQRDEEFIGQMLMKTTAFFQKHILLELFFFIYIIFIQFPFLCINTQHKTTKHKKQTNKDCQARKKQ